jgi:acyl dehydratase
MMLLHGEQFLEIKKKLPTSGKLSSSGRIIDILDKGKGAVVVLGVTTKDASGDVVTENEFSFFIRGMGGFGGRKESSDRGAATASNDAPSRPADAVVREKVPEDLAALYRLSGDYNPLHIDPNMASMGGFDVPILHGLATFGIAGKHIFKTFCKGDPSLFKSIKVRFAKHVFPGETIETHMWKEGSKVIFIVKVVERDVIAVSNAAVELNEGGASSGKASASAAPSGGVSVAGFDSSKIFVALDAALSSLDASAKQAQCKKVKAVFAFDIKNAQGKTQTWYIDLAVSLSCFKSVMIVSFGVTD